MLPRKLEFKDRFVERLVQEIPYACSTEPILFPDNETPIKFMIELSQNEFTALLSAVLTGGDLSYPERSHEVMWSLLKMVECPVDICEVLTDCLQPLFDEINTKLDSIQSGVDSANDVIEQVRETQEEQSAKPPQPQPPTTATSASYAGALALIRQMHTNNLKYYAEAEGSFVDNASEALSILLEVFPKFQGQTYDEAFELGNAYFENQVVAYEADYNGFEVPAACDLMCRIEANDGELDIDVWGDWLFDLTETVPDNAAANVFTRYSPLRQTFLNQIAALFNQEQSLQSYFEELWQVYYAGTRQPVPVPPECACPIRVEVPAFIDAFETGGVDSFFDVVLGEDYEFSAFGEWEGGAGEYDADGQSGATEPTALVPSANIFSLCYKIGELGTWAFCGSLLNFTAGDSGRVYFAMNDVPGAYGDNSGFVTVDLVAL